MRWAAIIGNLAMVCIAAISGASELARVHSRDDVMAACIGLVVLGLVNVVVLARLREASTWLDLFWKRKAAEERRRLEEAEKR